MSIKDPYRAGKKRKEPTASQKSNRSDELKDVLPSTEQSGIKKTRKQK